MFKYVKMLIKLLLFAGILYAIVCYAGYEKSTPVVQIKHVVNTIKDSGKEVGCWVSSGCPKEETSSSLNLWPKIKSAAGTVISPVKDFGLYLGDKVVTQVIGAVFSIALGGGLLYFITHRK